MRELVKALEELRYYDRSPFGLFVAEALRSFGAEVTERRPTEEEAPHVAAAVGAYVELVAREDPFRDVLGPVYMEWSSRGQQQWQGQFFTPWDVCLLMAQTTMGEWEPSPAPDGGLWSVHEPACGSGAMLLAWLSLLVERHGPEALLLWHVEGIDLDLTVARTCALQVLANLAIRGWSIGRVIIRHGDSLRVKEFSTVLHASNGEDPEALPRAMAVFEVIRAAARATALLEEVGRAPDPEHAREVA
jgi:hypothetical protein